jgi:Transcription factor WhiB
MFPTLTSSSPSEAGTPRLCAPSVPDCPVLDECLKWTLEVEREFGIFANTSERKRRAPKRDRHVA